MNFLYGLYAGDTIPANHSLIEYTGRIDFSDSLAPEFSYSGVSVRTYFSGSSISAIVSDDQGQNYYNVILDNNVYKTIHVKSGRNMYILAEGLSDTMHEIELFKRTELTFGKTQFHGFIVDNGASLHPISNTRQCFIEYIGNSITCGYGNEGELGEVFGPVTENHYLSYAAITSRNFNARHMAVSRSGIGVYRNYNGPFEGNSDCMSNLYSRIFLYDAQPIYDFSVQPDLICINLGTNDFSTTGADSALFVSNYFRLIDTIQTRYLMPNIVCLVGSMLSGTNLTNAKNYIQFIADSANTLGKGNVTFFEMSAQNGNLGFGVDYHPTVAQHNKNAKELTVFLQSLMNWKLNPLITEAKTTSTQQIQVMFNTPVFDPSDTYSGFSVTSGSMEYTIQKVSRDETDHTVLQITLVESMSTGEDLFLTYTPGSIESTDAMKILKIFMFPLENEVTTTNYINNPIKQMAIELFPNPTPSNELNYSISTLQNDVLHMNYEIIGANGVTVQKGDILQNVGIIPINSLSGGVYTINFVSNNYRKTLSFIKI